MTAPLHEAGHPTPHMMKVARPEQVEASVRLGNVWDGAMRLVEDLVELERDVADVSLKAAVHAAQHQLLDAVEGIRRAIRIAGGGR